MKRGALEPWYEFKAQADDDDAVAELHIFGPIGGGFFVDEDAVTGKNIAQQLDELPDSVETIRVLVNSEGGSVFDGLHIANALRRQREEHGRSVEVSVEALAASAATLITSAGDSIRMPRNALMMVHNPSAIGMGDAALMRELAGVLDKVRNTIIATYRWVSKLSRKKLGDLMDATTWMEADEALANGFITKITEPVKVSGAIRRDALETFGLIPEDFRDRVFAMLEPDGQSSGVTTPVPGSKRKMKNGNAPNNGTTAQPSTPTATAPVQPAPAQPPAPAPTGTGDAAAIQAAATAERERLLAIQNAVRVAKVSGADPKKADEIQEAGIKNVTPVDEVREQLFELLATNSDGDGPGNIPPGVTAGEDEHDKRVSGICAALYARSGQTDRVRAAVKEKPEFFGETAFDPAEFRGMTLLDFARDDLERRFPGSTRGKTKMAIAGQFLNSAGGAQGTSDFAVALEEALHKILQASYMTAPDSWRTFCRVGSVSDFRAHNRYRMGFLSRLDKVLESGEFKNKTLSDAEKEVITAATWGNILALTRQAIINDDMGVFSDVAMKLGRAAGLSIELEVFDTLALNSNLGPTMNDGKSLFHADHNNLGGGAAIAVSSLDADRVVLASQTDPSGNEVLDLRPAILVLPIGLGGAARVINNSQYDTEVSSKFQVPNKVAGLFREIVDTPRLSGTRRYLFADPSIAPVLEVAFLDGEQTPFMELQNGWRIDGAEWKVRHDFGVAGVDFRGAVTDAGA